MAFTSQYLELLAINFWVTIPQRNILIALYSDIKFIFSSTAVCHKMVDNKNSKPGQKG